METHALHQRGWKIVEIARHTGRDRKTIRFYLNGATPEVLSPLARQTTRGLDTRAERRADRILAPAL